MKRITLFAVILIAGAAQAAHNRAWQTGRLLGGGERQSQYVGSTAYGAIYAFWQDFTIQGADDVVYHVRANGFWHWSKLEQLAVNSPVQYAVDNDKLIVLDGNGKERKMTIMQSGVDAPAPTAPTVADPEYASIVYKLEGTAATASITISNETGGTEQRTVALPWSETFNKQRRTSVYLSAQNKTGLGWIKATIFVDGQILQQATEDEPYGIAGVHGLVPKLQ